MPPSEAVVTVRDIIHLALPSGTTVAGGSSALEHKVEWVTSLRAAFPLFGSLDSGYLAIARLSLARGLDNRITPAYLIAELHRVEAAALVVDEPISEQDAHLADEFALPVICLPPASDLYEIERSALRTIIDREGQITRRELEIRQRLYAVFERGGIESLLAEAAAICGGRWVLYTPNHSRVASAGSGSQPQEQQYLVSVAGRTHGQLSVFLEHTPTNLTEQITVRQTVDICGIALVELTARREAEERFGAELIEQLLNNTEDGATITKRLERLGLSVIDNNCSIAAVLGGVGDHAAAASEDVAFRLVNISKQDGAQAIAAPYRHLIVVIMSTKNQMPDRTSHRWLQQAFEPTSADCMVGVGRCLHGVAGIRQSVLQAIDAWDLGQYIKTTSGPFYYEELGLYRLLARLRGNDEMHRFYQETLGALADYDKRHNAELVHTLAVFFEQNANASQAARALYIHRNTLNYRLQRICEITGLNLEDPEARLAFQIALKIHRISA
ncbi:MAG: helix-turn-helix domain-containing protein [Chloroflexi bacterium]|nr:helix-turn-helix domain-containing protein [Chloroflexota bacterium]